MSEAFRDLLGGAAPRAVRVLLPLRNMDTGEEMTWREFLDAVGRAGTVLGADSDWGELSELSGSGSAGPVPRCETAQGAVSLSTLAKLTSIVDSGYNGIWHGLSHGPAFSQPLELRGTFRETTRRWSTRGLSGQLSRQDGAVHFSQLPYADSLLIATTNDIASVLLNCSLEAYEIRSLDTRAPRMTL